MDTNLLRAVRPQLDFAKRSGIWLRQLVIDVGITAAIVYGLRRADGVGTALAVGLAPVLFFNAFSLFHEAVHRNLSDHRWINDLVGVVAGAFCFLPYEPWRQMPRRLHPEKFLRSWRRRAHAGGETPNPGIWSLPAKSCPTNS